MIKIVATPEVTEVVTPARTAAEAVLDLPVGSVVTIRSAPRPLTPGNPMTDTVLHRTGVNGWMITRALPRFKMEAGRYHSSKVVRAMLEAYESAGATFTLVDSLS